MESLYGSEYGNLEEIKNELMDRIEDLRKKLKAELGMDPIEHVLGRVKDEESMREKCIRKGLPVTRESALFKIHDAIGIRVVCAFLDDVYRTRDYLEHFDDIEVVEEKDYIRHAKESGYRSLHLILKIKDKYYAEIQIRTISMDTWASLEHHIHYKKEKAANDALISSELKRCADELASTDVSMQTLRDMILEEIKNR
ncbi:MAG: GTP pyrophosphokinase family protein [Lachnospiraceae bacterium]|nr:GTP pyrophosphokinase family protein [Lachnospiraceae bacterium]